MGDHHTRLQDIRQLGKLYWKPNESRPAFLDCPEAIRNAVFGRPPEPKIYGYGEYLGLGWPVMLFLGIFLSIGFIPLLGRVLPAIALLPSLLIVTLLVVLGMPAALVFLTSQDYAQIKPVFDSFAAEPEIFRDEIFKAAVQTLPELDFYGRHRRSDEAKVGRYEREMLEHLRALGVQQEVTVANRGRPFVIHQYELLELGRGKWPNGDSKNYMLDLAILWPERRIKYNIEIDGPEHIEGMRPQKDLDRNACLTGRGWFVRRLNHTFMSQGRGIDAARDIVSIVYFFAKYANNAPLEWGDRMAAWLQGRRFVRRQGLQRQLDKRRLSEVESA